MDKRLILPTPLKKRDIIEHQGHEYQIIKFLRTTRTEKGLIYRARDIRTNDVVNVIFPFDVRAKQEEEGEADDYFQILDINEDEKEVTLKSFATGNERRMKVRWDEDVELIRDGLMMDDKDLVCTLKEVMGKEVIGDFKFVPKGPPIMRLPNELMEMIFSPLTPEDRLSCRLVTRSWATLLPIKTFVKCTTLFIFPQGPNPVIAEFHRLDIPNHKIVETNIRERWRRSEGAVVSVPVSNDRDLLYKDPKGGMNDLQPLISTSLLEGVDKVKIKMRARAGHLLDIVSQHCHNLTEFDFRDESKDNDDAESNWMWGRRIIGGNHQQLQRLDVTSSLRELDLSHLQGCTALQDLDIQLSRTHSIIRNFQSLPPLIICMSIRGLAVPVTNHQVLWISNNLPQLEYLFLEIHHNHRPTLNGGYRNLDEDEVDEGSVLRLLSYLPLLQFAYLRLGQPIPPQGVWDCRGGYDLRDLPETFHNTFGLERKCRPSEPNHELMFEYQKFNRMQSGGRGLLRFHDDE